MAKVIEGKGDIRHGTAWNQTFCGSFFQTGEWKLCEVDSLDF